MRNVTDRKSIPILLLIFILLIVGFIALRNLDHSPQNNAESTLYETRFFVNSGCMSACWQGLHPGTTTSTEISRFFEDHFPNNFKTANYEDGITVYSGSYGEQRSINAAVKQQLLLKVDVASPAELTVGKVIQLLGQPQYIRLAYAKSEVGSLNGLLETYYTKCGFIFISNGIEVSTISNSRFVNICLREDTKMSLAHIVVPGSIESLISSLYVPYTPSDEAIQSLVNQLESWPGFVCVTKS
jgi:hypothetical protein